MAGVEQPVDEMRAQKTGPAGYQDPLAAVVEASHRGREKPIGKLWSVSLLT